MANNTLFCDDINMCAAEYAAKRYDRYSHLWQVVVDAYCAGAATFVLKERKRHVSEDFVSKVEEMRQAQRDYFRTRSEDALRLSMRLEKEVDYEISRVKNTDQLTLF